MHDIEPYYHWRDRYVAEEDDKSPFFGEVHDEFLFTNRIYNYLIHPQWDAFGSPTLYGKLLFVDYDEHFAIIEFIGEWNDCLTNDIMHIKRNIAERLMEHGISKFCLVCENVLNFHGSDELYYEEWHEDISEMRGWIVILNPLDHVETEMRETGLAQFVHLGGEFTGLDWRSLKPQSVVRRIDDLCSTSVRYLTSQ